MNIRKAYSVMADSMNNPRVFLAWVVAVAVGVILTIGWLSQNFVTKALGEEMMSKAQQADSELSVQIAELAEGVAESNEQIKASNALLMIHMDKDRLDGIMTEIRGNEAEVFQIQQFISVNGDNAQSRGRLRDLKAEHEDLELRRDCIINNNPLCD